MVARRCGGCNSSRGSQQHVARADGVRPPALQASTVPGEGNAGQALYWQVSDDWGESWSPPRTVLPPHRSRRRTQLPYWSPVLHTQVRVQICIGYNGRSLRRIPGRLFRPLGGRRRLRGSRFRATPFDTQSSIAQMAHERAENPYRRSESVEGPAGRYPAGPWSPRDCAPRPHVTPP